VVVLDAVKSVCRRARAVNVSRATRCRSERNLGRRTDAIFRVKGESNNGMYKATIGREATCMGEGGKQMGVNTGPHLPADSNALVDGDFAMTTDELQPVLKRSEGRYQHRSYSQSHDSRRTTVVFLHYWGKGPAAQLARSLKTALDRQTP
jgi:hypothetical protein